MNNLPNERGEDQVMYEQHPVYRDQRWKLEETFTGKKAQIKAQFHRFWKKPTPVSDKKVWEKQIIAHDTKYEIICNWASFDVLQYQDKPARAGMSMIHLLGIPRDPVINGIYLTNGVDLTIETVDVIDDMINLFKKAWMDLKVRNDFMHHQVEAIERRAEASAKEGDRLASQHCNAALAHCAKLDSMMNSLDVDRDFQYGLHLRPDSSAPYLHLHIIAAPYEFRKYSTSEHDTKTKDAIEVRDFVREDARSRKPPEIGSHSIPDEESKRSIVEAR